MNLQPLPADVSPTCEALVTALLQRDPADRPSIQDIAEHPWLQTEGQTPSQHSLLKACMTAQANAHAQAQLLNGALSDVDGCAPGHASHHGKGRRHRCVEG